MTTIYRSRTIRPSSRKKTSTSYKIDTSNVSHNDILVVTIDHESLPMKEVFHFSGQQLQGKQSIHFRYIEDKIIWSKVHPE